MTRTEMIEFLKNNPFVHISHRLFDDDEYIYSDKDGLVWTEGGYLFEDWGRQVHIWLGHDGIRMRRGTEWETGWYVKEK